MGYDSTWRRPDTYDLSIIALHIKQLVVPYQRNTSRHTSFYASVDLWSLTKEIKEYNRVKRKVGIENDFILNIGNTFIVLNHH